MPVTPSAAYSREVEQHRRHLGHHPQLEAGTVEQPRLGDQLAAARAARASMRTNGSITCRLLQPRVPHLAQRGQLEREHVGLARVAQRAAVADHRVGLVRLEALAAAQPGELVGAEVDRAVGDRPRREAGRERGQAVGHARDELIPAPLLEQRARMIAGERLEHHHLRAQQADPVDWQVLDPLHLRGL